MRTEAITDEFTSFATTAVKALINSWFDGFKEEMSPSPVSSGGFAFQGFGWYLPLPDAAIETKQACIVSVMQSILEWLKSQRQDKIVVWRQYPEVLNTGLARFISWRLSIEDKR